MKTGPLGGEETDVQFELLAPAQPTVTQTATPESPAGNRNGNGNGNGNGGH